MRFHFMNIIYLSNGLSYFLSEDKADVMSTLSLYALINSLRG